ncbi:MAG: inositol monophosphatase family protein, partial [Acidimicrobiales bacterium]
MTAPDDHALDDPAVDGCRVDDHALAADLARRTGELLVGLLGDAAASRGRRIDAMGDRVAHPFLVRGLARHRPDDAVLSEEGQDDPARLDSDRVWILDPLDGSSDFGWSGQWSVHVGLSEKGLAVAGAVAVPALGATYATNPPAGPVMSRVGGRPVALVARSRRHIDGRLLVEGLDADVLAVGSAGVKAMAVVRGEADLYLHGGGMYEWDSCAPAAVAMAAGLHASRLDGSPLRFNRPDPWAPGLVICRRELADDLLGLLGRAMGRTGA